MRGEKPVGHAELSVISYNLKRNKAYPEITRLANTYAPDILCLQECFTKILKKKASFLRLASKTSTGKLGLAIYYHTKRFKVKENLSYPIKQSVMERLRKAKRPRLLITCLYDKLNDTDFYVGCFHATEISASNYLRRQQIKAAVETLTELAGGGPAILIGDFNYPFFKKSLHRLLNKYNFSLAASSAPTFKSFYYKGEIDFAVGVNFKDIEVTNLPFGLSDHAPILASIKL